MRANKTTKTVETITLEMTVNQAKLLHALVSSISGNSSNQNTQAQFAIDLPQLNSRASQLKVDPNELRAACTNNIYDSLGHVLNG